MKHIGWCLEKIQEEMAHIPRALTTQEDKAKATKILDEVQQYSTTLAQLVTHKNFRSYLSKLQHSSIQGVQLQAHEIQELFKDLEHALYVLDVYVEQLREIIEHHPEQWSSKADQIVLMIDQKFGAEKGELRKEFQVALHKKEELEQLITSEEHLAQFLK